VIVIVGGKRGLFFFLALAQKSPLPRLLRCTLHFRNGSILLQKSVDVIREP
jgi:hypothetical protein